MRHLPSIVLLAACAGTPGATTEPAPATAPAAASAAPAAVGTVGQAPPSEVAVPDFAAIAHTGEARSRADLLGHPTVVWFFPAAGTPG